MSHLPKDFHLTIARLLGLSGRSTAEGQSEKKKRFLVAEQREHDYLIIIIVISTR